MNQQSITEFFRGISTVGAAVIVAVFLFCAVFFGLAARRSFQEQDHPRSWILLILAMVSVALTLAMLIGTIASR